MNTTAPVTTHTVHCARGCTDTSCISRIEKQVRRVDAPDPGTAVEHGSSALDQTAQAMDEITGLINYGTGNPHIGGRFPPKHSGKPSLRPTAATPRKSSSSGSPRYEAATLGGSLKSGPTETKTGDAWTR